MYLDCLHYPNPMLLPVYEKKLCVLCMLSYTDPYGIASLYEHTAALGPTKRLALKFWTTCVVNGRMGLSPPLNLSPADKGRRWASFDGDADRLVYHFYDQEGVTSPTGSFNIPCFITLAPLIHANCSFCLFHAWKTRTSVLQVTTHVLTHSHPLPFPFLSSRPFLGKWHLLDGDKMAVLAADFLMDALKESGLPPPGAGRRKEKEGGKEKGRKRALSHSSRFST